jgi:hypothetical protein
MTPAHDTLGGKAMARAMSTSVGHLRSFGWVLFVSCVFLVLFELVAGRMIGRVEALWASFGIAFIVAIVFLSVLVFNIAMVGIIILVHRLLRLN